MAWFWQGKKTEGPAVSADFRHALTQEVLRTELIRIKALIGTAAVLGLMLLIIHTFDPYAVEHLWHGRLKPTDLYLILVPFILFELWVHMVIDRHLRLGRDLPVYRRYLGALIETSMPTFALALHIDSMGPVEALGFVVPLTYFIFIILSTLRLDFWLSTFTGFVAAVRTVLHGDVLSSRGQRRSGARSLLSRRSQRGRADLRHAGGRGRRSIAPAIRGQHHGRDRARPHHQSVRPARLAAGGRAADGGGRQYRQRHPPRRRHVRRFPQLYRGRAARARRRRWSIASTARLRCWSISSTAMAAS